MPRFTPLLLLLLCLSMIAPVKTFAAFPAQAAIETTHTTTITSPFKTTKRTDKTARSNPAFGIASFAAGMVGYLMFGLGLAAMYSGGSIIFLIMAGLLAVGAIVLGAIGFNKKLKGLAIAGFVLGIMLFLPFISMILSGLYYK